MRQQNTKSAKSKKSNLQMEIWKAEKTISALQSLRSSLSIERDSSRDAMIDVSPQVAGV